ncbi:MAG: 1-acyl-sn-glycerol-3-phosphate acyltransferase [Proteobacteria bacterium]|nr:1-acyl-sn-glycerol-3-phosphate acyltransferase [Pseudomonadota bacterium]
MQRHAVPVLPTTRSRHWLPDAGLDAHPAGSWLLEMGFDLWIRAFYRRDIAFPPGFHVGPGTLIASNHQRDVDGPMLGTILVQRRGLRFQWPLPFFATREDLFRPGILSRLTVHWPRPLSALLGHLSLAWFFPLGRAEPMRRVREFTLGETLRALCDAGCESMQCATLLNPRGLRELGGGGNASLGDCIARAPVETLEAWWGLRRLTLPAFERLAPAFRDAIAAQLAHFVQRLEHGRCVYFAPEGTISMDGHFGRTRAGFFRLCRATSTPPWIQPMSLSYDSLAAGRTRVVVRIGPRLRADPSLDRRAFDAALRHLILSHEPITPSHLLAHYLLHGPSAFTRGELVDWLTRCLAQLRADGASLDPLWARQPLAQTVVQRLHWLARKRLVANEDKRFQVTCPRNAAPGWESPANIVRYLDNRLADLAPGLPSC